MAPDRRPPPRPDRQPALDQQPERQAVGRLREQPPTRTKTLPGMHVPVRPPPLPGEFAPTKPAPALDAPTVRYTPAGGLPAQNPEAEAQRRRAEAAEAKLREFAAQFPPPVSDAPKVATVSTEPPPDRRAWSKLAFKLAQSLVGAAVLVIAAAGYLLVAKINAAQEAIKRDQASRSEEAKDAALKEKLWKLRVVQVQNCWYRQQSALNRRQFPEHQQPSSQWPIFKDECGELPEPP